MSSGATLRASVGVADITPAMGIQIAGDIGRYRPVEEVRDPIFAKALVLEAGGRRVCWLVMDILAMTRRWGDALRRQAAERFGMDADAVMVHIIQNHAAPAVGHFFVWDEDDPGVFPKEHRWLLGGDDRYNPVAIEGALKAIGQAVAALQPVTVRVGRGVDGRVAFNRRFVLRDGTVRTHGGICRPDVLCTEGTVDPEVGVMSFTASNGEPLAVILHHTCHPVHGYPHRWVSAGWPGAWCNGVKALLGKDVVPLVFNGFCGNIHHTNHLDPAYKDDYQEMGRKLTESAQRVMRELTPVNAPTLDWRHRWIRIPLRRLSDAEIAEARRVLREHPDPVWKDASHTAVEWDWVYAASRMDLMEHYRRDPFFDYFIQVFRLGNTAVVAVPGEPFVEEQLRIKLESPAAYTFTAHMSNLYVGYIPTAEAFQRGGYETRTGAGSKLAPEALRLIGDNVLEMLRELFPDADRRGRTAAR